MKLSEILENEEIKILYEYEDLVVYGKILNEKMDIGIGRTKGGFITKGLKTFDKFAKVHPMIVGAIAGYATDALRKYKKNKRNTITFYTKDTHEKVIYKDMVDQLMKSGKYRKEKETFIDGGYLFVLKRLG